MLCDVNSAELSSHRAYTERVSRTVRRNDKHTRSVTFAINRKRRDNKPSRACLDRCSRFHKQLSHEPTVGYSSNVTLF